MNLNELIYDDMLNLNLEYNSEIMSDLQMIKNNYKFHRPILISNRLNFDLNNYIKTYIKYPILEKWDSKCNKNEKCIICLDIIHKDELVYNLKCGTDLQLHIYHKFCFEKWNKQSCPYCRQVII